MHQASYVKAQEGPGDGRVTKSTTASCGCQHWSGGIESFVAGGAVIGVFEDGNNNTDNRPADLRGGFDKIVVACNV